MEATVRLGNGERIIKIEGETAKDVFEGIAMAYEVFNETECGLCGSKNIRPVHRTADKFHFYEYHCQDCYARLSLGQLSDNNGSLFPVRKLMDNGKPSWKNGAFGEHKGWTKFKGDDNPSGDDSRQQQAQQQSHPPKRERTVADRIHDLLASLRGAGAADEFDQEIIARFVTRKPALTLDEVKTDEAVLYAVEYNLSKSWKEHGRNLLAAAKAWARNPAPAPVDGGSKFQEVRQALTEAGAKTKDEADLLVQFALGDIEANLDSCKHNTEMAAKAHRLIRDHIKGYGDRIFDMAREWHRELQAKETF